MLNACRVVSVLSILCVGIVLSVKSDLHAQQPLLELIAHWKLNGDTQDASGNQLHAENHGVTFVDGGTKSDSTYASFGGRGQYLVVPHCKLLDLGNSDFSVSLWVHTEKSLDDDIGDLISKFDPVKRSGFQLSIRNNTGVTSNSPNSRQLQFGVDSGSEPTWTDLGRPGGERSILPFSLAELQGSLFAGTCEGAKDGQGNVYRFKSSQEWEQVPVPQQANSVSAMAVFDSALYAGTAKYRLGGSALSESENPNLGGQIFRLDPTGKSWVSCGRLPNTEGVGGMTVYKDRLYASSLYRPAGFFRYEGGENWTAMPTPNGKRTESLGVFNGYLWATGYDEGHIYRFDGESWTDMGVVGDNTQTYSFAIYEGRLCIGTWPSGKVYRLDDLNQWEDIGRLGQELEVMGMLVHNGKLYAGTLPLAEVYRYDGGQTWTRIKQLDETPNVKYRRVWTMASHQGRLACGVLPSGHVHAMTAGACTTSAKEVGTGWRHVAAVRRGNTLQTFCDGQPTGDPIDIAPKELDISNQQPLRIGAGAGDTLNGGLQDVRIYRGALTREQIRNLSFERKAG
jgi:hypothetical protein